MKIKCWACGFEYPKLKHENPEIQTWFDTCPCGAKMEVQKKKKKTPGKK